MVTGSLEAGDNPAAHTIAGRLQDRGYADRISPVVDLRVGPVVGDTYLRQVQLVPLRCRWMARSYRHA
jgi:hypothetical protein